jgi:hypothetical protein
MYTLTVKIAAIDTPYTNLENPHLSDGGHMWYSISDGSTTESRGFASDKSNIKNITKDTIC